MARKKTITHDQILNAAYDLVVEQGLQEFHSAGISPKDELLNTANLFRIQKHG